MRFANRVFTFLFSTFFKLLYNQLAWTYDWVAATVSVGLWKEWVFETLPHLTGPAVLEIGHGPGHLQTALHARGVYTVGLDRSRQMGGLAFRRLKICGYMPVLVNGYAQNLPFQDRSFHQVVATFPTEYLVQPRTLAEIFRVLAPRGTLLVLPVAWITSQRFPYRLAAWLFRITGQSPGWDERFEQPFRKAGFDVHVVHISRPYSTLLLIKAIKPVGNP